MKALTLGKSNTTFKVDDFTEKKGSIIFTGRQITYKNRQIYYPKEEDMSRKDNKEIYNIVSRNKEAMKILPNILRVEQNITSFDKMRQAAGIKSGIVTMSDMLLSKEKPLYDRHQIIMRYANQIDLFDTIHNWNDYFFDKGFKGALKDCNGSIELLLEVCKAKTKRRNYYN